MINNILVQEIMSDHPICVKYSETLENTRHLFSINNIHHVPVVNDEHELVGIISNHDLNTYLDWTQQFNIVNRQKENARLLNSMTNMDICTKEVFTVRPHDDLETCYKLFLHNRFHCLPVINEKGKVVGIITTYDMLKVAFKPNSQSL
jgi:CBS-domain-containing membrane protein